jgi:hypothetical protein
MERNMSTTNTSTTTMTNDERQRLPWTRDLMTLVEFDAWIVTRQAAAAAIDLDKCEVGCWAVENGDSYGRRDHRDHQPGPYDDQPADRENFIRSGTSDGWISECELPVERWKVLARRIEKEINQAT